MSAMTRTLCSGSLLKRKEVALATKLSPIGASEDDPFQIRTALIITKTCSNPVTTSS